MLSCKPSHIDKILQHDLAQLNLEQSETPGVGYAKRKIRCKRNRQWSPALVTNYYYLPLVCECIQAQIKCRQDNSERSLRGVMRHRYTNGQRSLKGAHAVMAALLASCTTLCFVVKMRYAIV